MCARSHTSGLMSGSSWRSRSSVLRGATSARVRSRTPARSEATLIGGEPTHGIYGCPRITRAQGSVVWMHTRLPPIGVGGEHPPMGSKIKTSHAGSLPRPDELLELNLERAAGEGVDEAAFAKELEEATVDVV